MIRRLAFHPKRGGAVQWQHNYQTNEDIVTVAGVPIVACSTTQERIDEIDSIMQEVRPARESRPEAKTVTQHDIDALWGE